MYRKELPDFAWEWFSETYSVPQDDCMLMVWHCVKNGVLTFDQAFKSCFKIVEHTGGNQSGNTLFGHLMCLQVFTREGMSAERVVEIVVTVVNSMLLNEANKTNKEA